MKEFIFPISLNFKISSLANDFTATDSVGNTVAYVRQKMFKLKEDISVYSDESRSQENYKIKADKWLDFSAAYQFTDSSGKEVGKIVRKGWASIWKAHYELVDQFQNSQFTIREANAWVKVWDSLLGEIPIIGMLTGYFFNPSYQVTDQDGAIVAILKKEPSFFGRKFTLSKEQEFDTDDSERIILGLMMLVLLERRKG